MKLFEAFEALDALNEETFAVSDDGVEKLDTFMQDNEDSDDIVDVIDPEAETEEDIQDSYVGKVILDCSVCHSKIYKDKTEVTIDEEQQLANVGEDCPYCYTSDGFKVIGEVAPFADKDEDTVDVKEEEEEVVEESLTEAVGTLEKPMSAFAGTLSNVMTAHQSELANVGSKVEALAFLDSIEPEVKNKGYLATVKEKVAKLPDFKVLTFLYNIILKGDGMGSKLESLTESHRGDRHRVTAELFDILSENGFDTDAEDVEDYVFAARDLVFEEVLSDPSKSIREIVEQWFEDTKVNYPEDLEALTRFEEGIFGIKTKKEKGKEAKAKAEKERQKQRDKELKDQEERARQQSVADSWARNDRAKRDAEKEYNRSRSTTQSSRVSNTGKAGVHYSGGDYYSEGLNESKSIKESIGFKAIKKGKKVNESWEDELEDAEYDEWFMDNLYNEFSNIAFELVEKEGYTDVFTEPSTQMGEGEDFFWAEKDGKSYCGSYDFQSEQDAFWECAANSGSREEAIQNCAKKYAEIILSSLELDEDEDELTESKSIKEDLPSLDELIKSNGHKLTRYDRAIKGHKYMTVFDYSKEHGGTLDSFKYYNDYYVDITPNESKSIKESIDKDTLYLDSDDITFNDDKSILVPTDIFDSFQKNTYIDIEFTDDAMLGDGTYIMTELIDDDYIKMVPFESFTESKSIREKYTDASDVTGWTQHSSDEKFNSIGEYKGYTYGKLVSPKDVSGWYLIDGPDNIVIGNLSDNTYNSKQELIAALRTEIHRLSLDESKYIKEDINNLSLDTDDTHMEMSSDENGKVTITTEPIEKTDTSDEVIVPVSDETVSEIENSNFENEEDVDFEEFDETSFDELGESYLKESFDNVVAFRTNEVIMSGDDLIVEGLIKFDSGNVKKTSFTFTAKDFLKEGLYRFVGKNNQLVESNSFELVGKIKDTKFICESLTEVK